jgi:cell division protein FtsA
VPKKKKQELCWWILVGGTTDIAIFQDDIIRHTAVIPLGGNVITDDIKEGCSIIKVQAEALKVNFGSALASENRDEEIVSIPWT